MHILEPKTNGSEPGADEVTMNQEFGKLFKILLTLSGIVFSLWMAWPLYQSGFLRFEGNDTVNHAANWMGILGIYVFMILLWPSQMAAPSGSSNQGRRLVRISIWCAATLLAATAVFNIWVNPWDLYGTEFFQSRTNPSRRQKLGYSAQLEETPDLIIIGNSTAFTISPQYIRELLGFTSFNWAIDVGRPAENRVLLKYLANEYAEGFPKVILMQVSEKPTNDFYDMTPIHFLPYLPPDAIFEQGKIRLSKLVSISQWADSVYVVRHALSEPTSLWGGWDFDLDGFGYKFDNSFTNGLTPEQFNNYRRCNIPEKFSDENIEAMIAFAEEHESSIVFYISPLLPEFYDAALKDAADYQNCHQTIADYFRDLTQKHVNVFFADYLVLEDMDGIDGAEGFYDERHPKPENAERLIDALADTLRQAYAIAETQRSMDQGDVE